MSCTLWKWFLLTCLLIFSCSSWFSLFVRRFVGSFLFCGCFALFARPVNSLPSLVNFNIHRHFLPFGPVFFSLFFFLFYLTFFWLGEGNAAEALCYFDSRQKAGQCLLARSNPFSTSNLHSFFPSATRIKVKKCWVIKTRYQRSEPRAPPSLGFPTECSAKCTVVSGKKFLRHGEKPQRTQVPLQIFLCKLAKCGVYLLGNFWENYVVKNGTYKMI